MAEERLGRAIKILLLVKEMVVCTALDHTWDWETRRKQKGMNAEKSCVSHEMQ